MQVWQLILSGVLVHLVLFYSIFDIYFTSPLVHGMTPIQPHVTAPAKRLVLFVTDGLRADRFYELDEHGKTRAPFLREIIHHSGAWGVSHTRVPTESRPGHVALIAGFYEDVSAVAKGWKENPVEFDSVFNQSRYTWSWGSPDILPMFAKGATGDHVAIHCYPSDLEDFAGQDMTVLDTWVFDQVKSFLSSSSTNATLIKSLNADGIVFFLHLLGLDTNGHSNKPHSSEYLNNIHLVDRGVKTMVNLFEEFYGNDGKTAYIMSADHGMTDWGSHGAGHPHETLTPFVAWGAGVRQAKQTLDSCGEFQDRFCKDWNLEKVQRSDMEQADVAPLMSSLIGVPFPVNSVGRVPLDVLNASDSVKAQILLANAQQILAQFEVKMNQIKARTMSATFRPFVELLEADKLLILRNIRRFIESGQYRDAMESTHSLIDKALRGLRYYQTYDRMFLGLSVVLGFLGWMSYILYLVLLDHTVVGVKYQKQLYSTATRSTGRQILFAAIALGVFLLLTVQSLPLMCYIYCLMPVALWYMASEGWGLFVHGLQLAWGRGELVSFIFSLMVSVMGLEIIVLSFYHRELLSVALCALAMWPVTRAISKGVQTCHSEMYTWLFWALSCLMVAVFPFMPVVGRDTRYPLVILSGLLLVAITVILLLRKPEMFKPFFKSLVIIQLAVLCIAVLIVKTVSDSISQRDGLPALCQIASWILLVVSILLPLLSPTGLRERLSALCLSFTALYLLLSITYEGLFVLSLLCLLNAWLNAEYISCSFKDKKAIEHIDFHQSHSISQSLSRPAFSRYLELSDLRRAFIFVFLILTAFFGTGNIASINSFDPASVYCFLTVFNPFLMGALMMLKNLIPFFLVTCAFRGVHVLTEIPLRPLFLIVLLMSDFMGLHFFFMVKDSGSWLEIGTTISHYVIVMTMIIFLLLLTGASHPLTTWRINVCGKTSTRHKDY